MYIICILNTLLFSWVGDENKYLTKNDYLNYFVVVQTNINYRDLNL